MRLLACLLLALSLRAQEVPYWPIFSRYDHAVELAAQVRQESWFRPHLTSPVGARGLCQFMPATWIESQRRGWIPVGADPWDPALSIQAQAGYMSYLVRLFRGDWAKAWAGYNCGEGRVQRVERRVLGRGIHDTPERRAWLELVPEESRNYVIQIETVHVPWVRKRLTRTTPTTSTATTGRTGLGLRGEAWA